MNEGELDELLKEAAREWAQLDADDDGEELAMALMRKAYAQGYVAGLKDRE